MSNRIKLGRSGLEVSPICYGSWQLSPKYWGDVPAAQVVEAARRAFEVDVNFYDTADAYGDGRSEQVIGEALAPLPRDQ
ncbi:MAG: aldo/keto reductase, partial [Phycisphaerae bacterium]|nr:aldo/keto reductase [Phycisphaerae bacterium]